MRVSYRILRVELSQACFMNLSAFDTRARRIVERPQRRDDRIPGVRDLHIPGPAREELRVDGDVCGEHREANGAPERVTVRRGTDVAELDTIAADDLGMEQQRLGILHEDL